MVQSVKTPTNARQASKEGVVRWILIGSTLLVIVVFIGLFLIAR